MVLPYSDSLGEWRGYMTHLRTREFRREDAAASVKFQRRYHNNLLRAGGLTDGLIGPTCPFSENDSIG
jgi:hypothetical protein